LAVEAIPGKEGLECEAVAIPDEAPCCTALNAWRISVAAHPNVDLRPCLVTLLTSPATTVFCRYISTLYRIQMPLTQAWRLTDGKDAALVVSLARFFASSDRSSIKSCTIDAKILSLSQQFSHRR
jgi:hypothetical protein